MKIFEGNLSAEKKRFGLVVGRFNEYLTKNLLDGAIDCIKRHGGSEDDISVAWVPGAFELGFATKKMQKSGSYDAIISLGVIIRGGTPHFDYIAGQASRMLGQINMEGIIPVSFGIVMADTIEQAIERCGTKMGNKGWQAALTAIEMANLATTLK
ncbi:MAG: 6,7-dimethyl-8-ribityllumazine synthase [Candidatus Ratteibacteria bacterium]|jgi:6,7-dimethyl-8-ribityllumazine synthase